MSPPVRVVCRGCLRSVELASNEEGGGPSNGDCPHCGQPLDSRSPGGSLTLAGGSEDADGYEADASSSNSDWTTTWTRGSLGSLGRFQLRERLGDGGFGEVFLAYDPRLDRDVALKVLRLSHPSERVMERFFREARAAARLNHPNIVAVHDAGFDRGRCWVAYDYVSGRPLWWRREHQPFDARGAARILRELADAVDHAHRQGVLHRDIKPANILIDDQGRPRLIDFGLARRSDHDSSLTRDGAVVGTPAYMSPEQALGLSRQVDERSDVFSLGVILFELLVGRRPDLPTTPSPSTATGDQGRFFQQPSPQWARATEPAAPRALRRICQRATAEKPSDRYPCARALADDLDAWLRRQDGRDRRRTFKKAAVAVGIIALTLAGFVSGWTLAAARSRIVAPPAPVHLSAEVPVPADATGPSAAAEPARAPDPPIATPSQNDLEFVVNVRKKRYHLATCDDVRVMSESNIQRIASVAEAVKMGLKPCEHCQPSDSATADSAD